MTELPVRFKERMKELLGDEYEAFEASYDSERVQGLRFNSLKAWGGTEDGSGANARCSQLATGLDFP